MIVSNESLVSEFRASALTQAAFCKLHDISIERLRYYLYKKKPQSQKNHETRRTSKTQPSFVCLTKDTICSNGTVTSGSKMHCTIICGTFTIAEISELTGLNRR